MASASVHPVLQYFNLVSSAINVAPHTICLRAPDPESGSGGIIRIYYSMAMNLDLLALNKGSGSRMARRTICHPVLAGY